MSPNKNKEGLEAKLSIEKQVEVLDSALEASSTPVEFYKNIGPYLSQITLELLDIYKSRMWVKYLRSIKESLTFKGLDVAQLRKALAQLEGASYLSKDEIEKGTLSEQEKGVLQEVEAAIAVLRTYKDIAYLIRDTERDAVGANPSQVVLALVKARKLLQSLKKEGIPIFPGLPAPRELGKSIKGLVQRKWLEAALAREEGFINWIKRDIALLSSDVSKVRGKGSNVKAEELEGLLERYFALVMRYNRAVKEYKRLERRSKLCSVPLEAHREKLEEIRLQLDKLKMTRFLTLFISGRELLNP